ncbi:MAG: chorismate synthase [Candidatus Woesearchaeota archaeon]
MGDTTGKIFQVTNWGESHGPALGGIISGCPSGIVFDIEKDIMPDMKRRKPGQNKLTTQRSEDDSVNILSGVLKQEDGTYVTTGHAISFMIANKDAISIHYKNMADIVRPNHADYAMIRKYGIRDVSGGGRSSARMTAIDVAAGALAKKIMRERFGTTFLAYIKSIGNIEMTNYDRSKITLDQVEYIGNKPNLVRCPDHSKAKLMESLLEETIKKLDSIGAVIECYIDNVPEGLGEPWYDKLDADLAHTIMGINAVKGVEIGLGYKSTQMYGSKNNDIFVANEKAKQAVTKTNNSGGIQGGMSNGMPIYFTAAFKPTATIFQDQPSVNVTDYNNTMLEKVKGRHDPCVALRATPIVEARAALVLLDHALMQYGKQHYKS